MEDSVAVSIATSLVPRLIDEAERAAGDAVMAKRLGDPNTELQRCLVAILCAHAAVEARMNETGFALDLDWWREVERLPIEQKWEVLAKKQLGKRLPRGHPASRALADLTNDRHLVAHHKGLKQEDDSFTFAAPPVVEHGGRSHIRVHFDAARAKTSVERAKLVVEHLVAPT